MKPFHWYKVHVIRVAVENGLPDDYIMAILAVKSEDDPENTRHQNETAIC